jgi:integrase
MARKPRPRAKSGARRPRKFAVETLTAAEVEQLLEATGGNGPVAVRNRAVIALLWRSGLRISEALSLRPADVDAGKINVRRGKGSKQRVAFYDSPAVGYLSAWEVTRGTLGVTRWQPLFCTVSRGEQRTAGEEIDPSYYRHLLPKLARRAGIHKRVHAHCLRHTHASELSLERLRLPMIAQQLGHSSTATTDAYLRKITASELGDDMRAIGRTVT